MKKYLEFYHKCMKTGRLPKTGLCYCFDHNEDIKLFYPPSDNGFWGYDGRNIPGLYFKEFGVSPYDLRFAFTPLRQNIVLFLAAMNNEL